MNEEKINPREYQGRDEDDEPHLWTAMMLRATGKDKVVKPKEFGSGFV